MAGWDSVDFERGLNKAVNHLREALGDSADKPRFIETLPRKGYRFIAPVVRDELAGRQAEIPAHANPQDRLQAPKSRRWVVGAVAALALVVLIGIGARRWVVGRKQSTPQILALAVIPLENLSHDPEQEYFADGMTDALITDLAKMGSVRVISRTSVMRYKQTKKTIQDIGRELNVEAVVEGTVTRSGNRVRIHGTVDPGVDRHALVGGFVRAGCERDSWLAGRGRDRHCQAD